MTIREHPIPAEVHISLRQFWEEAWREEHEKAGSLLWKLGKSEARALRAERRLVRCYWIGACLALGLALGAMVARWL